MASSSLRLQLLVWLLVPLGGVVAANTWLTYRTARITAGSATEQGLAVLRVQDNGPWIPVAERDQVFERFYRVRGREGEGSGLGLAIVREIVRAAGGTISLGDPPMETGLVVVVRLPLDGTA